MGFKKAPTVDSASALNSSTVRLQLAVSPNRLRMDRLIRTMVQNAEIPLADAVRMASETPARIMGVLDRKGTLERGKDADIIALDRDLNVRAVWAMGQLVEGTNKLF